MLRSKRLRALVVCFDRIDEPLSPSGLQSLCTTPILKQSTRYLLRGADGMTFLALHCKRNEVTLLENPMALRHLREQCEARKEFSQPLGFGGDYHVIEDFVQGIKKQAGTVLVPVAGRIGGVTMLARTADLAKEARLKVAPVVQGGPLSLLAVARSLSGRDEVLWVTSPNQEQWLKNDGVLKIPLRMTTGSLVAESCEIDETKFQVKRIVQVETTAKEK